MWNVAMGNGGRGWTMSGSTVIEGSSARLTAVTAIMTASVMVATIVLQIPIPATGGYFNLGEALVYISALLFGPFVGAFAGGVGSMLADVSTGFAPFAPGTFAVKGIEGLVVGYLSKKATSGKTRKVGGKISIIVGSAMAFSLWVLGMAGGFEPLAWIMISVLAGILLGYVVYLSKVNGAIITLSMLAGGMCMVIGYFLYEQFIMGTIGAIFEIPFNILQALVGIVIAFPVSNRVSLAIAS
jgi:uncharacterized membrane protein